MGSNTPTNWKSQKQIALENKTHMNNLPVPNGSWQENYNERNAKWSKMLYGSLAFLGLTVYAVSSDIFLTV